MSLVDILFPRFCVGCGTIGVYLCRRCSDYLQYVEKDRCIYCRRPSLFGFTHPLCHRANGIDGMVSVFHYNFILKKILKAVKYRFAYEVLRDFLLLIRPSFFERLAYLTNQPPLFFQPIPMHPIRLKERGFNQATYIADFLHRSLSYPLSNSLVKIIHTPPQASQSAKKIRRINIKGAFDISQSNGIKGTSYILVDDVITTGATVMEAARVLKRKGAVKVFTTSLAVG